jgi:NADPH2:quinone reductase
VRAVVITAHGGPEVLAARDVDAPVPGARDLLVRVHASALNRADLLQRMGLYPAPEDCPQDIPGLELAGVVEGVGAEVTRFAKGDRVMGIVGGGAAAELCVLHEDVAIAVPGSLTLTEAAAIPEAFLTAYDALVLQGGLSEGEWLAVNAVGSGVGTAAVQIARAIGAKSIGCSRTAQKVQKALDHGLDIGVVGTSESLSERAFDATDGIGVAVALDLVGGGGLIDMLRCLRKTGALVLVGLMGGARAELNLTRLLTRRLHLRGTVLRSRSVAEKAHLVDMFQRHLLPLFEGESPVLRPVVDREMSWTEVAEGHRLLEENATFGKVVLIHDPA